MENFNADKLTKEQIQEVFDKRIILLGIMGDAIDLPDDWISSNEEKKQYSEERDNNIDNNKLYISIKQF